MVSFSLFGFKFISLIAQYVCKNSWTNTPVNIAHFCMTLTLSTGKSLLLLNYYLLFCFFVLHVFIMIHSLCLLTQQVVSDGFVLNYFEPFQSLFDVKRRSRLSG